MILSYKYLAYPEGEVEANAIASIDAARYVYNHAIERFDDVWKNGGKLSYYDLQNELPGLKKEHEFLKLPYSHMLQITVRRAFDNMSSLAGAKKMGRRVGRLRFKGKDRFKSIRYNSQGYTVDREKRTVTLAKIGTILFEMHRPVPEQIDGVVLKCSGDRWYVIFQCEVPDVPERIDENNIVGIDVGVKFFVVDSDGNEVENQKFLSKKLSRLKFMQKSLSRKEKGSNNRDKARRLIARLHEKVANTRNDRNHQVSRRYVNAYDVICVEDLDIKQMVSKQHKIMKMTPAARKTLRRNMHDAAWGDFIRKLEYKAEGAGKRVIRIEAMNTTQTCSKCGQIVLKDITGRIHSCPYCGFVMDRDENAAVNIKKKGIAILKAGNRPEPVEEDVTTARKSSKRFSMKQEAHTL